MVVLLKETNELKLIKDKLKEGYNFSEIINHLKIDEKKLIKLVEENHLRTLSKDELLNKIEISKNLLNNKSDAVKEALKKDIENNTFDEIVFALEFKIAPHLAKEVVNSVVL